MKIAVISDLHANFVALKTIAADIDKWRPDIVVAAGDIINRGPRPLECLQFILDKQKTDGWLIVRGNHEDYVISQANNNPRANRPSSEVHRASYWTYGQIGYDISFLKTMPDQQSFSDPNGGEVRVVHGSMMGNRDGIYPETSDEELRTKIINSNDRQKSLVPSLFCAGHTHRPLIRRLDNILVVNAGSAGLPFDNDARPSYAKLLFNRQGWQAEIVRLEYDMAQAQKDFITSGYIEGGGPLVKVVQVELQNAQSHLYYWAVKYQQRALTGEISMGDSVDEYLQSI